MTSSSRLPEFIGGSNGIKILLKIEDRPLGDSPIVKLQDKQRLKVVPKQFDTIELPPVFSHMSFLLIETLSGTQHGEFITRSKQSKYETLVELSSHISHRYRLSQQEVEEIQKIYDQILETWIVWRQTRNKT
jgi:hypothetical protein